MNLSKPLSSASRIIHALFLRARSHLPRQRSVTFGEGFDALRSGIGPIFVINLDRQTSRWTDMVRELGRILDAQGMPLSDRVVRYSACDAQADPPELSMARWFNRFIRWATSYSSNRSPMRSPMYLILSARLG